MRKNKQIYLRRQKMKKKLWMGMVLLFLFVFTISNMIVAQHYCFGGMRECEDLAWDACHTFCDEYHQGCIDIWPTHSECAIDPGSRRCFHWYWLLCSDMTYGVWWCAWDDPMCGNR
jgi:hypothetical protein